jgi:hypothetical protein
LNQDLNVFLRDLEGGREGGMEGGREEGRDGWRERVVTSAEGPRMRRREGGREGR